MEVIGFIKHLRKKNIVYYNVWMPIILNFEPIKSSKEIKIPPFLNFKKNTYYRAISYGIEVFPNFVTEYELVKKKGVLLLINKKQDLKKLEQTVIEAEIIPPNQEETLIQENDSDSNTEPAQVAVILQENEYEYTNNGKDDVVINEQQEGDDSFSLSSSSPLKNNTKTTKKRRNNTNSFKNEINDKEQVYEEIISYLNECTGKKFQSTTKNYRKLINSRISDGYSVEDFKRVIQVKSIKWIGTEHEDYLRPETLFSNKFQSYLNESISSKQNNLRTNFSKAHEQLDLVSKLRGGN